MPGWAATTNQWCEWKCSEPSTWALLLAFRISQGLLPVEFSLQENSRKRTHFSTQTCFNVFWVPFCGAQKIRLDEGCDVGGGLQAAAALPVHRAQRDVIGQLRDELAHACGPTLEAQLLSALLKV